MMRTLIGFPSGVNPETGVPHIHSPYSNFKLVLTFVQGFIEGPTPNPLAPLSKSRRTLFKRYDFPVRYIPATDTIPKGPLIFLNNSFASFEISKAKEYYTSGMLNYLTLSFWIMNNKGKGFFPKFVSN